jgi:hypothetical protein
MQQHPQPVGNALHHGGCVGESVKSGGQFRENHGAATFFLGNQTQAKGFQSSAELTGKDGGLGGGIVVKAGLGDVEKNGKSADDVSGNQQGSGQNGGCTVFGNPGIEGHIHVIDEDRAPVLCRFQGYRSIARLQSETAKTLGLKAIGFRADQSTFRSPPPKIDTARLKKLARRAAKGLDELTGLTALKGGVREFEEKFLERLIRMR